MTNTELLQDHYDTVISDAMDHLSYWQKQHSLYAGCAHQIKRLKFKIQALKALKPSTNGILYDTSII